MTNEWLSVQASEFEQDLCDRGSIVGLHMYTSPYDVPQGVRGGYDASLKRFVIEFRYIAPEETTELDLEQHVVAEVGRNSGRIYRLIVDVDSLQVEGVRLQLSHVVDELPLKRQRRGVAAPRDNYRVAKEVMEKQRHALFTQGSYAIAP